MRLAGKMAVLTALGAVSGCATHAVRCDEHLEAINAPHPKPAKSAPDAPVGNPNDPAPASASGP
jgi:hypothetical protein